MSIPGYQDTMGPVLRATADGGEHRIKDVVVAVANEFGLTPIDLEVRIPSGQPLFSNRVHWAATYLKKAGLLEPAGRAQIRITAEGKAVLANPPKRIDRSFLLRYPSFVEFAQAKPKDSGTAPPTSAPEVETEATPRERIDAAEKELAQDLADELLAKVKAATATFFEHLVIDLLRKMGYGGPQLDAGQHLGKSGDAGLDGVIWQDRLGLEAVYVQAKRWDNTVSRPEVQKFAGSLEGAKARKGVFMTTATFSHEAREYTRGIEKRIVLIDGSELVRLMIEHNIGVSTEATVKIQRIDNDYFEEE